ncbi:AfsR/SARP family transcriptional regulator [Phytohabitans kaempferiae]|uniref:BTAD domain-containing putative transcriptional regulator n=1 Tax=Phytohabitans kaempferiae TaxID=1620943 RepID=A0ABV6M4W5_9ACTN
MVVKFGLLGPLLLRVGEQVEVTAAKQRTVLALLIARRNIPIPLERIVDEVWPEQSPESAVQNARTYISALRICLGTERDRLTTRQGSYRLTVGDDEVDTALFESQTAAARSALRAGELSLAVDRYEAALSLWRGDALQDVATGRALSAYGTTLTELGVKTREEFLRAQLLAGEFSRAVGGLRRLVGDYPLRESAWHGLITALHRSGDRAAALEAFQQARKCLAEGLGLDPGPELTTLHNEILKGSPTGTPRRTPPRQLPRPLSVLVGRNGVLEAIRRTLTKPSSASRIVVVHGIGGVGKSSVAIAAAHALTRDFPDGQLYVNLQGASVGSTPLEPVEVLGRFMRALGASEQQISPDAGEAAASFRSQTAARRILIVLDDARSAAQVLPLLPAGPGCGVLITSRKRLDTLDGVEHLHLDTIDLDAAVDLLAVLSSRTRVDRDPEAARDIARLCGRLPLAVRIMGTRLARHPATGLRQVADALARAQSRLDEFGFEDLSVVSTFDVGYGALPKGAAGTQARRLFWRLGRLDFAEITSGDAAALLDVDELAAQRALDLLADHGLVEPVGPRFRVHDLLRLYAARLAQSRDTAAELDAAVVRVTQRYVRVVRGSVLHLPMDGDPASEPATGDETPGPRTEAEACEWMATHLPVISALVRRLVASPATSPVAWDLLRALNRRLCTGYPAACVQLYGELVAHADPGEHQLAATMCTLSSANLFLRRDSDAVEWSRRAAALLPRIDDPALRARILCVQATALVQVGAAEPALDRFFEATLLYLGLGRLRPVSICLGNASLATLILGRYAETLAILRHSLALSRRHGGDSQNLSCILDSLAMVYLRLDRPEAALRYATASVRRCEAARYIFQHSVSLQRRSLALRALGRTSEAIADAEAAVALCLDGSEQMRLDALRNLGVVLWLSGDARAVAVLAEADALAERVAAP